MKTSTFYNKPLLVICVFVSFIGYSQLHSPPTCSENFTLDWSTAPTASNEYNWLPAGSTSNTYTDVDGSGIDFSVTFSGTDINTLGYWGGIKTPKVGNSSSTLYEGLDLFTTGFNAGGITCTIVFSSPIYALSFDMHHINTNGPSGDLYVISATTATGNTIYPTFTPSANPSYAYNNSTGVVNATGVSVAGDDAVIGINFLDDDYITSITFQWLDCLTCSKGNVHGSGMGNFSFCIPQTLDFDGVNDYINRAAFLGDKTEATMMSWVKLDNGFDGGDIMGQRNFRIFVDSNRRLKAFVKTDSGISSSITTPNSSAPIIPTEKWNHVAAIYDGDKGKLELFLNGKSVWEYTSLSGTKIINTAAWNTNHDFEIGRNSYSDNNYFEGAIYESRVYKKALSSNQIHRQINQEIENNSGKVRGTVIPKDIEDLLWSDLILYYKMGIINTGFTPDDSSLATDGALNNMRTYQERTAPLPYETKAGGSGDWSDENNWLYGSVWDITKNHPSSAIVRITEDLTTNDNHETVGLIVENGNKLDIKDDSGFINSWYVKLDGDIDLHGESQLVQTEDSDLDVTSSGKIERDQQGTADKYTYNYWSSPVGVSNITSNNNSYALSNVLRDGTNYLTPKLINFATSGYDGSAGNPITIADYWIWKFANQLDDDYASWQHVKSTGTLMAGEGFTMKGPGSGAIQDEQNYVFIGKPNNGDINLTINAGNDYLIGNPYPSAIDAHEFILDNAATIEGSGSTTGTLYFWEHWGGGSHVLAEYEGGYATYNLSGGVPAAAKGSADPDVSQTSMIGTKKPGRYIPVSQGFFVIGENSGTIKFRNSQRVFQKESSSSVFMEANNEVAEVAEVEGVNLNSNTGNAEDLRKKLRIGFNSVNNIHRQLLVTVDGNATKNIDYGFDGLLYDNLIDDMFWMIADKQFVIQGTDELNQESALPFGFKTRDDGLNTITLEGLENISDDTNIYVHDMLLNIYHDLKQSDYEFHSISGTHIDRFEITFTAGEILSTLENIIREFDVTYVNSTKNITILNPSNKEINKIELFNTLGQSVMVIDNILQSSYQEYKIADVSTGAYIVKVNADSGTLSKKVLIN